MISVAFPRSDSDTLLLICTDHAVAVVHPSRETILRQTEAEAPAVAVAVGVAGIRPAQTQRSSHGYAYAKV